MASRQPRPGSSPASRAIRRAAPKDRATGRGSRKAGCRTSEAYRDISVRDGERRTHLEIAIEYKANWELELEHRARTGATGPESLPHPDDVHININTGEVQIRGPVTKQEQAKIEEWKERVAEFEEELNFLRELRRKRKSGDDTRQLDRTIDQHEHLISLMRKRIAFDHQGMRDEFAAWKGWTDFNCYEQKQRF